MLEENTEEDAEDAETQNVFCKPREVAAKNWCISAEILWFELAGYERNQEGVVDI